MYQNRVVNNEQLDMTTTLIVTNTSKCECGKNTYNDKTKKYTTHEILTTIPTTDSRNWKCDLHRRPMNSEDGWPKVNVTHFSEG